MEALAAGPAGFYRPRVRGGGYMHCDMLCLGRHWNARTYAYEPLRADHDGLPAPALPPALARLAADAAAAVGFELEPDICLINRYGRDGRMGLHQDKDEDASALEAGVPVVSLSLGDSARFLLGRVPPPRAGDGDRAALGGCLRARRTEPAALSRRGAHPAGIGTGSHRSRGADQPDLPAVRAGGARVLS